MLLDQCRTSRASLSRVRPPEWADRTVFGAESSGLSGAGGSCENGRWRRPRAAPRRGRGPAPPRPRSRHAPCSRGRRPSACAPAGPPDEVARRVGQRQVQRQYLGPADEVVQFHVAAGAGVRAGGAGVADLAAEPRKPPHDLPTRPICTPVRSPPVASQIGLCTVRLERRVERLEKRDAGRRCHARPPISSRSISSSSPLRSVSGARTRPAAMPRRRTPALMAETA